MEFEKIVKIIKDCPRYRKTVFALSDAFGAVRLMEYMFYEESETGNSITLLDKDHNLKTIFMYDFHLIKNVFYLKKDFREKVENLYDDKSPTNRKNHVGVEIEFVSTLSSNEIKALVVNAELEKYVTVKDDGSIDTDNDKFIHAHEICILGNEKTVFNIVNKVCNLLKGNSKVNKTCGLHVHLDMRNRDTEVAYANLYACQPLLYAMCPPTRASNDYCAPVLEYTGFEEGHNDYDEGYEGNGYDRYEGINRASHEKHTTLEVRIHSGTLNKDKINNWIRLLIKIADKKLTNTYNAELFGDYSTIKKKLKLKGKLNSYIVNRVNEFKQDHIRLNSKVRDFKIAA